MISIFVSDKDWEYIETNSVILQKINSALKDFMCSKNGRGNGCLRVFINEEHSLSDPCIMITKTFESEGNFGFLVYKMNFKER